MAAAHSGHLQPGLLDVLQTRKRQQAITGQFETGARDDGGPARFRRRSR